MSNIEYWQRAITRKIDEDIMTAAFGTRPDQVVRIGTMEDDGSAVLALVGLAGFRLVGMAVPGLTSEVRIIGKGIYETVPDRLLSAGLVEWQAFLAKLLAPDSSHGRELEIQGR